MKVLSVTALGVAAVLALATAPPAHAVPTDVQLDPTGTGTYSIMAIQEFDWSSKGDLVIADLLPGAGSFSSGLGVNTTSLATWAATALPGDMITFDAYAHARLVDATDSGGDTVAGLGGLSTDGGMTGSYEITGALNIQETATLLPGGVLLFTAVSGTYQYFIDSTPDSVVATGAGFTDGTVFLTGNVVATSGTFQFGAGGNALLTNTVTSYDNMYIETDPTSNAPLTDTTFDTLVSIVSLVAGPGDNGHEDAAVDATDTIGLANYSVLAADLGLKADANTEFGATPARVVPEPATVVLMGVGLVGLAGIARRRRS